MSPPEEIHHSYQYTPLKHPEDIRLLHIDRSRNPTTPLRCYLETVSLEAHPYYTTLSYAWGPTYANESHFTHTIWIDGLLVPVTESLRGALVAVRRHFNAGQTPLPIWADAVCIDQSSNSERTAQGAEVTCAHHDEDEDPHAPLLGRPLGDTLTSEVDIPIKHPRVRDVCGIDLPTHNATTRDLETYQLRSSVFARIDLEAIAERLLASMGTKLGVKFPPGADPKDIHLQTQKKTYQRDIWIV
ncbi:uncharacterized protein LTR77_004729 [Saxophila tyrrhenica]|uniref:Heterokaryon incompatibility domain-containing protein n=1 Tax=Saxophila tyrrhenica TaxID=1690608 RepID=A0AAV9P9V5_9PEZI|nr:hypothetical protein LTR77_004729 [Saxophila tyrrhenica]